MKLLPARAPAARPSRRGAALMMALLVLFVLVLIVFQISIATSTDARIARNQTTIANMQSATSSVLLQIFEDLKDDGEADAAAGQGGAGGPSGGAGASAFGGGGADGAPEGGGGPTDSSQDAWARPGRYEINDLSLRILYQDEDSKYNLLAMLTEDPQEADKARQRVVRILDLCREGTTFDLDPGEAELMADAMLEHMRRRSDSVLPRPAVLSDEEEGEIDRGLPLTLREFVVLEPFDESHFRDFRDENGTVVHSIGSFLTVWTSIATAQEAEAAAAGPSGDAGPGAGPEGAPEEEPEVVTSTGDAPETSGTAAPSSAGAAGGEGGLPATPQAGAEGGAPGASPPSGGIGGSPIINVNRAPAAVLHGLMDDRDVPSYFWDAVLEYRNEEDEDAQDDDDEPLLDEFTNEELIVKQIFHSVDELAPLDGWAAMEPIVQAELRGLLGVQSQVFSVFVTARKRTGEETGAELWDPEVIEREEEEGLHLVQTVRCVLWRRQNGSEVEIVPLVHWEELDYYPFEVLDFPGEDR